jgi:hypothetical protein
MGVRNMRAICPNCGGKVHTQPKGLGRVTWLNSWFLVETGDHCQWCGVAFTGKVTVDNQAVLASAPQPPKRSWRPSLGHWTPPDEG